MTSTTFRAESLRELGRVALCSQGVPEPDAELTAHSLVQADQRGIGSHGMLRLPLYVAALRAGGINPTPRITAPSDRGAALLLDADGGLGQVAMKRAVEEAAERARAHGVSVVSVQNSSHYGAGAYWTDHLAGQGIAAMLTSSTGPTVAPFGSAQKVLGTNPLTMAMPTGEDTPLTVDLATSAGAFGKVIAARQSSTPLPEGWAVDVDGNPTTDPHRAATLAAFGGHKGSGIAVLLEAMSVGFGNSTFAFETQDIWDNPGSRMRNGHLLIAIDPEAFAGRTETESKTARLRREVIASGDGVRAPGAIEYANEARHVDLVPLPESVARALTDLAAELDVEFRPTQGESS